MARQTQFTRLCAVTALVEPRSRCQSRHRNRSADLMLVPTSAGNGHCGLGPEEFEMYEKCHQEQQMEVFDPMAMSCRESQHRMPLNLRQSVVLLTICSGTPTNGKQKKSKPPIESFQHYVAIVQDPYTSKIVLRSSSTMRNWRHVILGGEALSKFRECIQMPHGNDCNSLLLVFDFDHS